MLLCLDLLIYASHEATLLLFLLLACCNLQVSSYIPTHVWHDFPKPLLPGLGVSGDVTPMFEGKGKRRPPLPRAQTLKQHLGCGICYKAAVPGTDSTCQRGWCCCCCCGVTGFVDIWSIDRNDCEEFSKWLWHECDIGKEPGRLFQYCLFSNSPLLTSRVVLSVRRVDLVVEYHVKISNSQIICCFARRKTLKLSNAMCHQTISVKNERLAFKFAV